MNSQITKTNTAISSLRRVYRTLGLAVFASILAGCTTKPSSPKTTASEPISSNPVIHFEIPVTQMSRAIRFYETVFGLALEEQAVDGYAMAFFPLIEGVEGAGGALVKGDIYVPSIDGTLVYFRVDDISVVLEKAASLGSEILYPKKCLEIGGALAEIRDSEGNRIALASQAC